MTGLTLVWISTIVTTATTALAFVLLAQWSAGGAAPWSIVPGLVRGIRDWGQHGDDLEPLRLVSPAAQAPEPPIDVAPDPHSQPRGGRRPADDGVANEHDRHPRIEAELEELGTRRI